MASRSSPGNYFEHFLREYVWPPNLPLLLGTAEEGFKRLQEIGIVNLETLMYNAQTNPDNFKKKYLKGNHHTLPDSFNVLQTFLQHVASLQQRSEYLTFEQDLQLRHEFREFVFVPQLVMDDYLKGIKEKIPKFAEKLMEQVIFDCEEFARRRMNEDQDEGRCPLSVHLIFGLALYSAGEVQHGGKRFSLYKAINDACRKREAGIISSLRPFMHLLDQAIRALPQTPKATKIFRGVSVELPKNSFRKDNEVQFSSICSGSYCLQVAEKFAYGAVSKDNKYARHPTMLEMHVHDGRDISKYSQFPNEREVLFSFCSKWRVVDVQQREEFTDPMRKNTSIQTWIVLEQLKSEPLFPPPKPIMTNILSSNLGQLIRGIDLRFETTSILQYMDMENIDAFLDQVSRCNPGNLILLLDAIRHGYRMLPSDKILTEDQVVALIIWSEQCRRLTGAYDVKRVITAFCYCIIHLKELDDALFLHEEIPDGLDRCANAVLADILKTGATTALPTGSSKPIDSALGSTASSKTDVLTLGGASLSSSSADAYDPGFRGSASGASRGQQQDTSFSAAASDSGFGGASRPATTPGHQQGEAADANTSAVAFDPVASHGQQQDGAVHDCSSWGNTDGDGQPGNTAAVITLTSVDADEVSVSDSQTSLSQAAGATAQVPVALGSRGIFTLDAWIKCTDHTRKRDIMQKIRFSEAEITRIQEQPGTKMKIDSAIAYYGNGVTPFKLYRDGMWRVAILVSSGRVLFQEVVRGVVDTAQNFLALSKFVANSVVVYGTDTMNMTFGGASLGFLLQPTDFVISGVIAAVSAGLSFYQWYHGDLTVRQMSKEMVATFITCGVSTVTASFGLIAGAALGAAIGVAGGPVGICICAIIGALLGGFFGGAVANVLAKKALDYFWPDGDYEMLNDQRKSFKRALEVLGCQWESTHSEVKHKYKMLALEHHPDRGGKKDTFLHVVMAYEIVESYFKALKDDLKLFKFPLEKVPNFEQVQSKWKELEPLRKKLKAAAANKTKSKPVKQQDAATADTASHASSDPLLQDEEESATGTEKGDTSTEAQLAKKKLDRYQRAYFRLASHTDPRLNKDKNWLRRVLQRDPELGSGPVPTLKTKFIEGVSASGKKC